MPRASRLVAAIVLCSFLPTAATGQQSLTKEQVRHVNKVRNKMAHFATGTKLDVQLSDGSHQIGKLIQTGSTSFVIVDPASKSEAIDYLTVKRVQPTRRDYMSQQLEKTARGLPKVAVIALVAVAVIIVVGVVVR
jgi:hypothetical protein